MTSSLLKRGRSAGAAKVLAAIREISAGRTVVLTDDLTERAHGVLVQSAAHASGSSVAFLVRHSSGLVCAAMPDSLADRLDLPLMAAHHSDLTPRFTVTFDATRGVTTGISAKDRARAASVVADPITAAADLSRPGHVLGLRTSNDGVLGRAGNAEAAVDLVRSGGLPPVGLLAEIVSPVDPFRMALPSELANFALDHGLTELTLSEVLQFRQNPSHDRRLIGQRGWCRP